MLSYFRIHDPYRVLGLLVILTILFLPLLVDTPPLTLPELKSMIIGKKVAEGFIPYTTLIDSVAPLTALSYSVIEFVFGDSILARQILALIFVFGQAIFIGIVYIDKKVYPDNTFIPSLVFGLLFLFSFDSITLSGELFGGFFALLALNSLLKELEFREESLEMVLKIGVWIGIASLFEFSFVVFVPASLIIMLMFTRTSGRKFSLLVVGFLIPHGLTVAIYAILNSTEDLWSFFYLPGMTFSSERYISVSQLLVYLITPGLFLLASLFAVNRESRFTKYQAQILQAMFFWMVFAFVQLFFVKTFKPQTFILLIPAVSFYISHLFLLIRRKKLAELSFWIFSLGLVAGCYYARYAEIAEPAFEKLVARPTRENPSGVRLLVLDNALHRYYGNAMATPFLDWKLSKEIFENPEYYHNVVRVYEGFKADPPDVILDPAGVMSPFLKIIPELGKQYQQTPQGYQRR